ncbi:MAG: methanogenesis marker protein Mmp4/MtxX [Methanotrichaceae archaeon]
MDSRFVKRLEEVAKKRRAKIGIGVNGGGPEVLTGIEAASEYANIVIIGDPGCDCELEQIESEDPASELIDLLAKGEIDGAVRGNVSASRAMKALARTFEVKVRRLSILILPGWSFFLAPVGIDEGDSISDRLDLAVMGAEYIETMGIDPQVSVLSGGRMEDLGRSEKVDRTLADGELVAKLASDAGVNAHHREILIERCHGDDLIIAPDGISGNLIFRTLMLLSGAKGLGAPVIMDSVFVDSSRARKNFVGPIMLASALSGLKQAESEKLKK